MQQREIRLKLRPPDFWICTALALLTFFLRYPYLHARDLSWDEPFSVFYSQFDTGTIITELFKGNNPPFYELFLHYSTAFTGISEGSVRMPSILFSCGTVIFLYLGGKRLAGTWAGIFVALLFAYNNLQFFYSLVARAYALFSMLAAASVYLCIRMFQEPWRPRFRVWLVVVNTLLFYTHYFAVMVIAAQVIAWLFAMNHRPFFKQMFVVFVCNLVLISPALFILLQKTGSFAGQVPFVKPSNLTLEQPFIQLLNGMSVYQTILKIIGVGALLWIIFAIYRNKYKLGSWYVAVLLLLLWMLPIGITWYYSATYPFYIDRYYLYSTIPLFLFSAWCMSSLYRPFGNIWAFLLFIYIFKDYKAGFAKLPDEYLLREWQGATLKARELQKQEEGSMVFIFPLWADLGFGYYYDRSLYTNPVHFDNNLGKANVHRVWSQDTVLKVIEANLGKPIVYYCDESSKIDSTTDGNVRIFMQYGYVKDTGFFYQQCTNVARYKLKIKSR